MAVGHSFHAVGRLYWMHPQRHGELTPDVGIQPGFRSIGYSVSAIRDKCLAAADANCHSSTA
jgi:hypothetical protein